MRKRNRGNSSHKILADKEEKSFCLVMLNKSEDLNLKDVKAFDYEKLLSDFEKPLELRRADHEKRSYFGYMFTETKDSSWSEIERILKSDLRKYIVFKEVVPAISAFKD